MRNPNKAKKTMAKNGNNTPAKSSNTNRGVPRRSFLAAGLAIPFIVPRNVLGGSGHQAPSDTLRIAAVGIGGMGQHYLAGCRNERIVALCDLDHSLSAKVFRTYPNAKRFHDFRKMFDREEKNFDALIIGTPDHSHAILLMAAIKLNKHIYCAKPITHSIGEARKVRAALAKAKRLVTKSSVQSSATDPARSTTELLNSGVIGSVRELHIWCHHPAYPCSLVRPTDKQTPPPGMDWDLWIGPAPYRPYHSAYHPANWRPWWDFGTGTVGDMACHTMHVYFKELQLDAPKMIYGYGSTRHKGFFQFVSTPECQSHANVVTWQFDARDKLPPMTLHWYDGGIKPHRPPELDHNLRMPSSGLLFVGEKGKLITGYSGGNPFGRTRLGLAGGLLLPEKKFRDFVQPPKTMRRCDSHYTEWTQACKTGARTVCPVEFGCEMTELALLGTLALRTRRPLEWDAKEMRITNSREANDLIDPPYRTGWTL
ncbi:MAG: Gfo/Idh/MocA family oxidoreductase [Phycisphaerae bacterium]|nr:Gfo/Idh/MocA family oxidoreductase [Phycisphaerae bacterium]NIP53734.1 Gfo/Idh/MocA family oxidoreductase [Phycisphaerae bacterium]NIS51030.1 Gfo/Idh/MocA family oxidoreductase [Phycisphaerae bacterium]NIU10952.1 Gfo/Idh/MocA family oxidoreductase [Phycisphaerae bacterium]NIU56276.1 Gfo/Idh/MocA family oxidoreductase [Phycisphaerae bacterium]